MNIRTEPHAYTHEDQPYTGELVWDADQSGPRPGVLVFHGGAGLDAHARERATLIARLGYCVLAADLYGDLARGQREAIMGLLGRFQSTPEVLRSRTIAALHQLDRHPLAQGRVAAVGYCLGGMAALELARSGADIAAAISLHGGLKTALPAEPGVLKARVLVCHGALDPHVPAPDVQAFMAEMTNAGADWELQIYGGAQHGFTHDPNAPARPGVAYHHEADRRSGLALATTLREVFSR